MRYVGYWCLVTGLLLASFHRPPADPSQGPIRTIVIDAGHGGKDPGAVGKSYKEKDITLKVVYELRKILLANMSNVRVVLTRGNDTFVPLHQRGKIAKLYEGDFFVSIHCNASTRTAAYGSSTYILGINSGQERYRSYIRENEAILFEKNYDEMYGGFDPKSPEGYIFFNVMKNVFRNESMYLANMVQDQFKTRLMRKSRGVKQAPFIVLWKSGMPSILCEIGFITNPQEEKFIGSEIGQIYVASAIYRAIKDYNHEFGGS